jgi:hypothetical protein
MYAELRQHLCFPHLSGARHPTSAISDFVLNWHQLIQQFLLSQL